MAGGPVKDRFTGLDTMALVRELRALGPARVDKVFDDVDPEGLLVSFRIPGLGRRELRVVPGRYAALREAAAHREEELSPFVRDLRRLLSGAVVTSVADPAGERYLEVAMRRGDSEEPLTLAIELFGKGNVVVARAGTVVAVAHPRTWAKRTVRIGSPYQPPPSREDPWSLPVAALAQGLLASQADRVSTLAARLGFGGPVAEELLARAGSSPTAPAGDDAVAVAEGLHAAGAGLLAELAAAPAGYLYATAEGVLVDVSPVPSRRWHSQADVREERCPTFSEAVDRYFAAVRPRAVVPTEAEERGAELERQIAQQDATIDRLRDEVAGLRRQGDALFAHFSDVERAVEDATAAGGREASVDLEGTTVSVPVDRPVRASGQAIYDEMKKVQTKLKGAEEARRASDRRRADDTARPVRAPRPVAAARRHFWFEPYRWFVSSEGIVVIGGRDAASNDRIVKRYLGAEDRYVHADLHGAPSVVVKHPPPGPAEGIGEPTLAEACQFGLAFSKAWRAGRASGDAFWVLPEQVTKGAAAGEFVPRGAWVIHGTKHILRDLPVTLGVGPVRYEGVELLMVGPPDAVRSRGSLRFLLEPGEERDRAETEVALARELGIGRSPLQSMLPAGGIRFRRA